MRPDELDNLAREAHEALMTGQLDRGLALTDQCVRARPDEPVFYCWRARALLEMGKGIEAVQQARLAVRHGPEILDAHMVLADAAGLLGRKLEAQNAFREAIKLSRRDPGVLTTYALFMATECGPRLGEQAAVEAIEADAGSSYAWTALGVAQLRQYRHAEAESSLNRAVELDTENTWAKMNLAIVLDETGKHDQARALVELLQDDPQAGGFVAAARQTDRQIEAKRRLLDRAGYAERSGRPAGGGLWTYYARRVTLVVLAGGTALGLIALLREPGVILVIMLGIPAALWWWARWS